MSQMTGPVLVLSFERHEYAMLAPLEPRFCPGAIRIGAIRKVAPAGPTPEKNERSSMLEGFPKSSAPP